MLANTTVPGTDVTSLFPGLLQICAAQLGVKTDSTAARRLPRCECAKTTRRCCQDHSTESEEETLTKAVASKEPPVAWRPRQAVGEQE